MTIIPISWWWINSGRTTFTAAETGCVLNSGYHANAVVVTEHQCGDDVFPHMFRFEEFHTLPEGPAAWLGIESRMRLLIGYATKLGVLESSRFYGWFHHHMGDAGLSCSNVSLGLNLERCSYSAHPYVENLPKSFNYAISKMVV
jgi:hypothetical protein